MHTDRCPRLVCLRRPPVDELPLLWQGNRAIYQCRQCTHAWATWWQLTTAPQPVAV